MPARRLLAQHVLAPYRLAQHKLALGTWAQRTLSAASKMSAENADFETHFRYPSEVLIF
jgi:hypothetical protein